MFAAEEVWPTDSSVLETCFSRFKYLRLIDFSTFKHLRYLSLQRNYKLRKLLNTTCELQNLQTLRLGGYEQREELPINIKKMVDLRFFISTTKLKVQPENEIVCLRSLRFLLKTKSQS